MRKLSIISVLLLLALSIGSTTITPNLFDKFPNKNRMNQWVDSVFNTLSLEEKVGQLFMPIVEVSNTEAANRRFNLLLNESKVGGFLFQKGSPEMQATLTNRAQSQSKVPLLISLDGEWGLSMRLEGTTRFPRNIALGALSGDSLLYLYGREVARQCKEMGIHINFAPVMDVNSNPNNPVIGTRSFGEEIEKVIRFGLAYSHGLENGGVMSVSKHFPGHGDTSEDSHKTLPSVKHSRERLNQVELRPFREYIHNRLGGILVAHLFVPSIEPEQIPSSLSANVVTKLLQEEMGFGGMIFTDALAMKGAISSGSIAVDALKAGNDVLLGTSQVKSEIDAILKAIENGSISMDEVNRKCRKILAYKYILGASSPKRIETKGLISRLNTPYAEQLNREITTATLTLIENKNGTIPLNNVGKRKMASLSIGNSLRESTMFQKTLQKYNRVDPFMLSLPANEQQINEIFKQLSSYDCILIGIHSLRSFPWRVLKGLPKQATVVITLFASPYALPAEFVQAASIEAATLIAYENTLLAQELSAEALFGGVSITGKLPVEIGKFKVGSGATTLKSRLGSTVPEKVGISSDQLGRIDSLVHSAIKEKALPGCQVLIAKDGWVVYSRAFGHFDYANTHQVTPSDLYDVASLTKATATVPAVMWALERRLITLNDKLSKFFPQFAGTDKANITLRELLFHESGLRHLGGVSNFLIDKESIEGKVYSGTRTAHHRIQMDERLWANGNVKLRGEMVSHSRSIHYPLQAADRFFVHHSIVDSILNVVAEMKINPAKRYLYTDINFILLRMIVEKVSNKPMDELLVEEIYGRLGADNLLFHPLRFFSKTAIAPTENDEFIRRQMLIGYVHDEIAAFLGGVGGHAGLFANSLDIAKLCECWLNDGKYGGEQIFTSATTRLFTETKSTRSRRGLGFDKPEANSTSGPTGKYAPLSTYGHTGFTGTCFWVDPSNHLIYVFLSNRVYPKRWNKKITTLSIRSNIQDIIYESMVSK